LNNTQSLGQFSLEYRNGIEIDLTTQPQYHRTRRVIAGYLERYTLRRHVERPLPRELARVRGSS
jgi:hypothetical protein